MKLLKYFLGTSLLGLGLTTATAAEPLARLQIRNFGDLTNAIAQFAAQLSPTASRDAVRQFTRGLGLTDSADFDARRPWEIVVWYEGGTNQPLAALKAPIGNLSQFRDHLSDDGVLRKQVREWMASDRGYGVMVFRQTNSLTAAERTALELWKSQELTPPARLLELTVGLSDPLREQLKGMMAIAKMSIGPMLNAGNNTAVPGLNPKAMSDLFAAYLDILGTFLAGFQDLKWGLDLNSDALIWEDRVNAKPGTELASWLQKPTLALTAQEMHQIDPNAYVSGAGTLNKEPGLLQVLKKFTLLGFQMQGSETNANVSKEIDQLFDQMLPMSFSGSAYLKDGFSFTGTYRFAAGKAAPAYAQLKRFLTLSFPAQVGPDKLYAASAFTEKHRTVDGQAVDRFSLTLNTNSPLFSLPGQKQQLQTWWPSGKFEIDYVLKGDQLIVATADRMPGYLAASRQSTGWKSAFPPEESTCLVGTLNLAMLIQQALATNSLVPDAVKQKMGQLDLQGVAMEMQIGLDRQIHTRVSVPLKLIRELAKLKN
jgi:hypothetical protein